MAHRWIEHTGELEVELEAPSERGIFEAGFDAMRELLESDEPSSGPLELEVELSARERAVLLVDWLGELAFLAETRGLVPDRLAALELDENGLHATIGGWEGAPSHLVKGATYHRLRFDRLDGGWRAGVVLDV